MNMLDPKAVRAFLDERHVDLAAKIADFVGRRIEPLPEPPDDDASREQAREIMADVGNAGWFDPIRDQDLRACALIREALAHASPLADAVFALQALGSMPIVLAGSDELR